MGEEMQNRSKNFYCIVWMDVQKKKGYVNVVFTGCFSCFKVQENT